MSGVCLKQSDVFFSIVVVMMMSPTNLLVSLMWRLHRYIPLCFVGMVKDKKCFCLAATMDGKQRYLSFEGTFCILRSRIKCSPFAEMFFAINITRLYTVSQKKTSHFNFRHNFAIFWDIFTIFEAPCSWLIAGWCDLLHTHHRCEAFTWREVTHDVIQAVARSAHWHRISYHLTYGVWTHRP